MGEIGILIQGDDGIRKKMGVGRGVWEGLMGGSAAAAAQCFSAFSVELQFRHPGFRKGGIFSIFDALDLSGLRLVRVGMFLLPGPWSSGRMFSSLTYSADRFSSAIQ